MAVRQFVRNAQLLTQVVVRWSLLGGIIGLLAGTASALFLVTLNWVTNFRSDHPWLLFLLPLAGVMIVWDYERFGGVAVRGNNLILDQIHADQTRIPRRMAALILLGTEITHLFGGSAGREGTAVQMAGSLSDWLWRVLRLSADDRRLMLMAGVSGGFGSVFGTPLAGFVFGMEVQSIGRIRYEGLIPCLVASVVGDLVTRAWGVKHTHYPVLANLSADPVLLLKVALAGVAFGVTSLLFIELTHIVKRTTGRIGRAVLRPVAGAIVVIVLTLLLGTTDYLGLGVPLIVRSVDGTGVPPYAFLLKLVFTAITLGSGFLGGEVTPLFVIGSTLGYTLGLVSGVDPTFMASMGFVAVFAGASNTPLACLITGVELFGGGSALYLGVACMVAYLASGHRSIYGAQRVDTPKYANGVVERGKSLEAQPKA